MTDRRKKEIALETLAMLNESIRRDGAALTSSADSGAGCPERAYCDVLKEIIELTK